MTILDRIEQTCLTAQAGVGRTSYPKADAPVIANADTFLKLVAIARAAENVATQYGGHPGNSWADLQAALAALQDDA